MLAVANIWSSVEVHW